LYNKNLEEKRQMETTRKRVTRGNEMGITILKA
jgi:hypothetical protein